MQARERDPASQRPGRRRIRGCAVRLLPSDSMRGWRFPRGGPPTNPDDGEQADEVLRPPVGDAIDYLHGPDRPSADVVRLADI